MTRSRMRSIFFDGLVALFLFLIPYLIWKVCT